MHFPAYRAKALVCLFAIFCFSIPGVQAATPSQVPKGTALDLTSNTGQTLSKAQVTQLFGKATTATIVVGGSNTAFTPTSLITPSEMVAISQILNGNQQTLTIGGSGAVDTTVTKQSFYLPNGTSLASLVLPAMSGSNSLNLNLITMNGSGKLTITGGLTTGNGSEIFVLSGNTSNKNTFTISAGADSSIGGGMNDNGTLGNIAINEKGNLSISGAITNFNSQLLIADTGGNVTIASGGSVIGWNGLSIMDPKGTINVSGTETTTGGFIVNKCATFQGPASMIFSAGNLLSSAPASGNLSFADIANAGGISITATNNIILAGGDKFSSVGGNIVVQSTAGSIFLGIAGGSKFTANGGSLFFLTGSGGSITGPTGATAGDTFIARGIGTNANSLVNAVGGIGSAIASGVIQMGGTSTMASASTLKLSPSTMINATNLGSPGTVTITPTFNGRIVANSAVNLANATGSTATINQNITFGALTFVGPVTFGTTTSATTFTSSTYIDFRSRPTQGEDNVVYTGEVCSSDDESAASLR